MWNNKIGRVVYDIDFVFRNIPDIIYIGGIQVIRVLHKILLIKTFDAKRIKAINNGQIILFQNFQL